MGSTRFEGGSLQYTLQLNQTTQNPTIRISYKTTQCYNKYKKYKDIQEIYKSHPRAKHAPSGSYSTWTAFTDIYPLKHSRTR